MKTTDVQLTAAQAIAAAVIDPHRNSLALRGVNLPDADTTVQAIAGCLHGRTGQWRKSAPKDDVPGLLWRLVKFHGGSGNLWGWPWFADAALRDQLDSVAILLRNGRSSAADAWQRALHGR